MSQWTQPPSESDELAPLLRNARHLALIYTPASPAARALVSRLVPLVAAHEIEAGRKQKRGPARMDDLADALGAIVGGVLIAWSGPEPRAVFRSLMKASFTGARVGISDFKPAIVAMVALGFFNRKRGIAHEGLLHEPGDSFDRMAGRWWPTQALLDAASQHGLSPEAVGGAFRSSYSEKPPKLPPDVLQMSHTAYFRDGAGKLKAKEIEVSIPPSDIAGQTRRRAVERDNQEAAKHDVRGCLPPRWIEKHISPEPRFVSDWRLHGRRYSIGADGNYQNLPESEREKITIDGEPVIELDVKASHLTIVHGLLGLPLPADDLYMVEGLGRAVVKAWVVQTLGSGRMRTRWGTKTPPSIREFPHKEATGLILARYPFLADLSPLIPERYSAVPERWRLLPHILMSLEAAALSIASLHVSKAMPGTLVLPMHDALIVPVSAEAAARVGLVRGYRMAAEVTPRIEPEASDGRQRQPTGGVAEVCR